MSTPLTMTVQDPAGDTIIILRRNAGGDLSAILVDGKAGPVVVEGTHEVRLSRSPKGLALDGEFYRIAGGVYPAKPAAELLYHMRAQSLWPYVLAMAKMLDGMP